MPKRSEKRDAAKAEYLARKGRGELVDLRELAEGLGVNYQTLRNWKSADEWEKAEPKKKRGGQPGNRNSAGHKNAAGSHKGAPAGNHNAEKDGAYPAVAPEGDEALRGITGGDQANPNLDEQLPKDGFRWALCEHGAGRVDGGGGRTAPVRSYLREKRTHNTRK